MNEEYTAILILTLVTLIVVIFKKRIDAFLIRLKRKEEASVYLFIPKWYVSKISENRIKFETAVFGYGGLGLTLVVGLMIFLGF